MARGPDVDVREPPMVSEVRTEMATAHPATSAWFWVVVGLVAVIAHFVIAEPGTFPGWDESVFYSQSGDIVGVDSDPSAYSASREPGTPFLIGGLRAIGLNIEATRMAFMFIYVGLVSLAFYLLSPIIRWGALAGFVVMTGHWIPFAYSARLFGVPIATALLLVAVACGVRLLGETGAKRSWWWAAGLALSTIGMLAMRHLEAPIAAIVVFLVLLAFGARRGHVRFAYVLGAGLVALLGIIAIDVYRAIYHHGSVGAWVDALTAQLGDVPINQDSGPTRALKVLASLAGGYHLWFGERIPTFSWILTGIAALPVLLLTLTSRRNREGIDVLPADFSAKVLWWLSGGLLVGYLAMFILGRYPSSPKDRYLMWFVAAGALIVALALRYVSRRKEFILLGLAGIVWMLGGVPAAQHDIEYFLENGEGLREVGLTMHVLAGGEACQARARYGSPALQLASGCEVELVTNLSEAEEWLRETTEGTVKFLVYPFAAELASVPGWSVTAGPGSSVALWYRTTAP